jgi:hypothetical protein
VTIRICSSTAEITWQVCDVEPFVVYLDFQAIHPLTPDDLDRIAAALRPHDEELCVWSGEAPNELKACMNVAQEDFSLAAGGAVGEVGDALLRVGVAGEVRRVAVCSDEAQLVVEGPDLQVLERRGGQTYCDWCIRPLTPSSIAESERLGLDDEFAWACDSCLAEGAYHQPPDGFEPPESGWPYREQH